MLNRAVREYYRCPDAFLDFGLNGQLSDDSGFFRFGADVTCYGRSCSGSRQLQPDLLLSNLLGCAEVDAGHVNLPFDPAEVIENLRNERYTGTPGALRQFLRKIYYLVRPLLPSTMRKKVQRLHTRNWHEISFPKWPLDTTVENLCERSMFYALQANNGARIPFVWFWPEGARACVTMTHDIETAAGRDLCEDLMDLDDAAGIKASFQIVPEQRYEVYPDLLASIRRRGFEIGVQDLNHDGRLFDNRKEFERRVQLINRYGSEYGARGFRAAVLYRNAQWFDMLEFAFDMSIPNVAHLDPQRGGCCTVTPFFIGDILELPVTTTQDYTLFHLLKHRSIDLWKTQTEMILARNGLVSFIVHPDYLRDPKLKSLYVELLEYLRGQRETERLWVALPSDIERWWRARSEMSVKREGNSWRIVGKDSERAVLAFAQIEDGKVTYKVEGAAEESAAAGPAAGRSSHISSNEL